MESEFGTNTVDISVEDEQCVFTSLSGFLWGFAFAMMQITVIYILTRLRSMYKSELRLVSTTANEESMWNAKSRHLQIKLDDMTCSYVDYSSEKCNAKNEEAKSDVETECGLGGCSCNHDICSICLDDFNTTNSIVLINGCHHQFHRNCLEFWIVGKRMETCPYCRDKLSFTEEAEALARKEVTEEVQKLEFSVERFFKYGKLGFGMIFLQSLLLFSLHTKVSTCF